MIETVENNTHKYVVRNLQKDEVYVFLVTATNEYGESLKKGNCNGVKLPEGKYNVTLSNFERIRSYLNAVLLFTSNYYYYYYVYFYCGLRKGVIDRQKTCLTFCSDGATLFLQTISPFLIGLNPSSYTCWKIWDSFSVILRLTSYTGSGVVSVLESIT